MIHWLAHFLGLDNASGPFYLWWSGAGSDLTYLGALAALWHHLNCHDDGCWRVGRHMSVEDGTHVRRCRKHHQATRQPLCGAT